MGKSFTLIEIILALVIVGILAVSVMPGFIGTHDTFKIEGASRQLMQDIRYAQQLAISLQEVHGISFNRYSESYFVYSQTPSQSNIVKDPVTQKCLKVTYQKNPPPSEEFSAKFPGIDLVRTTFFVPAWDRLEFDSLGKPSCQGKVVISYKGTPRRCGIRMLRGITDTISVEGNTGRCSLQRDFW